MAKKKSQELTHINTRGDMHMVDIADKPASRRLAIAEARLVMHTATRRLAFGAHHAKGDVLAAARVAGIMAAKRTGELIPLCHPLSLTHVDIEIHSRKYGAQILVRAETTGPTGVEMEALTAASVAALTLYDMLKAAERGLTIECIRLLEKHGGRSGPWKRDRKTGAAGSTAPGGEA